jgi:hypothetical protein
VNGHNDGELYVMRTLFPFILVFLAIFTAACIAYIAWEVSSDKPTDRSQSDDN